MKTRQTIRSITMLFAAALMAFTWQVKAADLSISFPDKGGDKAKQAQRICQGTNVILEGLQRGDTEPLEVYLPRHNRDMALADLSRSIWITVGAYGPIEGFEVLGSNETANSKMETVARVDFQDESSYFRFVWHNDKLITFHRISEVPEITYMAQSL
jgi:hypothetical protein